MRRELAIFLTAVMFYTRIPCPKWIDHRPEYINLSIRYFPLIGWIVGFISGVTFFFIGKYFSIPVAIIFSLIVSVLTTGAFHEDGFADTCDAFGGGWTKDKILLIMKDSRLGTYGVAGLLLIVSLKMSLLYEYAKMMDFRLIHILLFFILTHSLSRFIAATFVFTHEYVRDGADSKSKPIAVQTNNLNLLIGAIWVLIPLSGLIYYNQNIWLVGCVIPAYLAKYFLARYFMKWIGGYTGDCLGATQQVAEIVIYITLIAIWKFV